MGANGRQVIGVDGFVESLCAVPGFASDGVWRCLSSVEIEPQSLEPYVYFSPEIYTRNLIYRNDDFELLSIGWEVGQASRIHNHRDQRCWMLVIEGQLKCQNYAVHDRDPERRTCRLEATKDFLLTSETPAQVEDEEPVHQILNLGAFGRRAVSLHIYAKPFDSCEVYQIDKGTYSDVDLYYTSKYGKLCDGATAVARA